MYDGSPEQPSFKNNHEGTQDVLNEWKSRLNNEGINFFLSFLSATPESNFGYDCKTLDDTNAAKEFETSDNYKLNSTETNETPIMRKPVGIRTLKPLMTHFDLMIRTTTQA